MTELFSYLDIYTGQQVLIGINNWVLYIGYLQKVKNKVMPYCFSCSHPSSSTCKI